MTLVTKRSSVLLIALLMFVGFQNCSKVRFAATDGSFASKSGLGDGLEDVDFPEDEELDPELLDDGDDETPVTNNDDDDSTDDNDDIAQSDCQAFASSQVEGINGVDVKIRKRRGDLVVSASQTLDVSNTRGSVFAKTIDAKHLRNMRGSLCLVGESLDKLNNHRGNIEIIGAHTGSIVNTRGTLIINGGSVDVVREHEGDIILLNGATISNIQE